MSLRMFQVLGLMTALAAVCAGCGGRSATDLRKKFLAFNAAIHTAPGGNKSQVDKLEVDLIQSTQEDPKAVIYLYTRDPDWQVRSSCATFLWLAGIKAAAPQLAAGAKSDPERHVVTGSLAALRELVRTYGSDDAVRTQALSAVHADLARPSPFGLLFDLKIVGQLKDRASVGSLVGVLPRVDPVRWEWVVDAIHDIGGKDAQDALRKLKSKEKEPKRAAHLGALLKS